MLDNGGERRCRPLLRQLRRDMDAIKGCCKSETLAGTEAQTWLRDNFYLLRRNHICAVSGFRKVKLPCNGRGVPQIVMLAEAYFRACELRWEEGSFRRFLQGFQTRAKLTEAELARLPDALRVSLLHSLAENPENAEMCVTALRAMEQTEMGRLLETESTLHTLFLRDPGGDYGRMDEASRQQYRRRAAELGRKFGLMEWETAEKALQLAEENACHVGEYLFHRPLGRKPGRKPTAAYLTFHLLMPLALTLLCAYRLASPLPMLLFLPIRESVKCLFDSLYTRLTRPVRLPRLDYSRGIPDESRTLAVSAVLLTRAEDAKLAAEKLRQFRLANRDAGENLRFGLLADLSESESETTAEDEAIRSAAETAIRRLNEECGGGFCLILRDRSYSERDRVWRGKERKRGAVMELTNLLRGEAGEARIFGDADCIRDIRFLIVLDGDTRLNMGAAAELAGIMAHPLNRAYGILQPRIGTSLQDAEKSEFARIFAGQGGLDTYGSPNSDVYQDLFGEGSYAGKGMLNVDAFRNCLHGAFPPETLLSHDLIEGAYVGCTYVSDVELTDGFPAGLLSYYERQHRWNRGDWQTLPWLFGWVRNEAGDRVRNPISPLSRWKVFDNLCRSLMPPTVLLNLLLFGFFPGTVTATGALLSIFSLAMRVVLNLPAGIRRGKRYRARVLPAAKSEFLQFLWVILLLPYAAYINLSAILTALYRRFISHRNLLRWKTAAEGDRQDGSVFAYCRRMWSCFAVGAAALFCRSVLLKALGPLWLLTPVLAYLISPEQKPAASPTEEQRLFLTRCASNIWHYFRDTMTAVRHFLPPDNLQESPQTVIAERTSPTNLGLALLSILAAADLHLIDAREGWEHIEQTIDTMLRLPRYRGHFYNWIDTRTLQPLEPAFISTVDSGNLLACLYVLLSAAEEAGRTALAAHVRKLCAEMRLDFLYDPRRCLLRIGWDPKTDTPSGGWYDLLESEARTTSYLAIARGEAPKKHWQRLGRQLASGDGMSGLASWTGTMFEYCMPALFLPTPKGSLLAESEEFCIRVQRRSGHGGVWGKSESAYARQDAMMNYAYQAFGAQKLALKRDMDKEAVIAPYAAFLALPEAPNAAVRDLRRLANLGAEGKYGYYDALDFAPSRTGGAGCIPVRTFMSHHLGMSILAIDNLLNGGIMQQRFLRQPEIAACMELLEEKTPVGQRIRTETPEKPEIRPQRESSAGFLLRSEGRDVLNPMTGLVSNGRYSVLLRELGYPRSQWGEMAVAAADPGLLSAAQGLCFFAEVGGETVPLQPLPFSAPGAQFSAAYDGVYFRRYIRTGGMEFCIQTEAAEHADGERNVVTVFNADAEKSDLTLALYLEPALCPEEHYRAHPAFHRLCMESELRGGFVTVTRRPGGAETPAALAVGCSMPFEAETDKALIFGRGGIRAVPAAMERSGSKIRAASELCVFLRVRLQLRPKERRQVCFVLAVGEDTGAAIREAEKAMRSGASKAFERAEKTAPGLEEIAFRLLGRLVSSTASKPSGNIGKDALWRFGVSGDVPTAACTLPEAETMLRCWDLLRRMGYRFDLGILTADEGVYGSPEQAKVRELSTKLSINDWEGKRGGWHLVSGSAEDKTAFLSKCDVVRLPEAPERNVLPLRLPHLTPKTCITAERRLVRFGADGVRFRTECGIGRRAWCDLLTNGRLGWLAADDGSGYLWLDNAREHRLTPWLNDPLAPIGGESLCLVRDGGELSLFAAADEYPTEVTCGFGFVRWRRWFDDTESEVVGFIPPDSDQRLLIVRLRGFRKDDVLRCLVRKEPGAELHLNADRSPTRQGGDLLGYLSGGAAAGGEACLWAEYPAGDALCLSLSAEKLPKTDLREAERAFAKTKAHWAAVTGVIRLESPEPLLDAYVNGWCLYQTLACRVLGRTGLYQSGGAYGFRDQLQDICALIDPMPELARRHILLAAAHQYEAGDVMHWWHPDAPRDKGVRTRCSDDLLWLPYAALLYAEKTGDRSILQETVPWQDSAPLADSEQDRYEAPEPVGGSPLIEHLNRAAGLVWQRGRGEHGLLRIGSGDWNDGFDRVGGESVWLTWFAVPIFRRLAAVTGDSEMTERAEALAKAANACWQDGQYLRAYFADGTPLGAWGDGECQLDSIAQSFAVFSGSADPVQSREAVKKAAEVLTDAERKIIRLFAPPFDGETDPGYIRSYLPGVRENGGQYTHAAIWLAAACLQRGETELGWRLLKMLLPGGRDEEIYQAEPFVLAADVYANPDMPGRGGWSWYTGAAGWFLRTVLEKLLGVRSEGGKPVVEPNLPAEWPGYTLTCRIGGADYRIEVRREGNAYRTEIKKL